MEPLLALALATDDFPLFAEHFLKIRNKMGFLVPMVLWPHQIQCWLDRQRLKAALLPVWRFILKYRQGGFSRYFLAETLFVALRNHGWNILIIAHKKKLPTRFLDDIRNFIKSMPEWCRPKLEVDSSTELKFTEAFGGSRITIASANTAMEGGGLEVGETLQRVHISEASDPVFKKDPLNELLQTVGEGCEVIVESTAKGIGNWFNEMYWPSKAGETKFFARFIPWNEHPEYTAAVPPKFKPTDEELELMLAYTLTPGQVMWRRNKIHREMRDPEKFKEQYPITDTEAFLFTGSSLFNLAHLAHFLESPLFVKDWPTKRGSLVDGKFVAHEHGDLEVYREPEPCKDYCIGVDVAEGIEGGDYSVVTVWDGKLEQCAEWWGHIDPYDLADITAALGIWYNEALLVVEENSMGSVVTKKLFRDTYYPNLYYRENRAAADDGVSDRRIGWHTSGSNKGDLVAELRKQIETYEKTSFTPHSERLVNECRTFAAHLEKQGHQRYSAQSGCHDDTVMAACICLQGLLSWQFAPGPVGGETFDMDKYGRLLGINTTREPESRYERALLRARHSRKEWGQA